MVAIVVMLVAPQGLWGLIAHRFDLHFFPVQRRLRLTGKPSPAGSRPARPPSPTSPWRGDPSGALASSHFPNRKIRGNRSGYTPILRMASSIPCSTLYIQIREACAGDTIDIEDRVTVDPDAAGHIIGLEILDAGERLNPSDLESITIRKFPLQSTTRWTASGGEVCGPGLPVKGPRSSAQPAALSLLLHRPDDVSGVWDDDHQFVVEKAGQDRRLGVEAVGEGRTRIVLARMDHDQLELAIILLVTGSSAEDMVCVRSPAGRPSVEHTVSWLAPGIIRM